MGVGGKVKSAFAYRFLLGWRRAVECVRDVVGWDRVHGNVPEAGGQ